MGSMPPKPVDAEKLRRFHERQNMVGPDELFRRHVDLDWDKAGPSVPVVPRKNRVDPEQTD